MENARILFVIPSDNEPCKVFVQTLRSALPGWNITITRARLTTLIFDIRKADMAHFFLPPTIKSAQFLKKISGKTRLVQTILGPPTNPEAYKRVLFGEEVVVFSDQERLLIEKHAPGSSVESIPPCIGLPEISSLQPSSKVRQEYDAGDRMLVVALSDVSSKQHFDSFLYICREYNRREAFRLLIPHLKGDKETLLWRGRLQSSIQLEKLQCVTLLDDSADLHSLVDSTDIALYLDRGTDPEFGFPLHALEALYQGKPVLCFDVPPLNEIVREFRPRWVVHNTEDIVRETRDLKKEEAMLEQISTELARFARNRYGVEKTASRYQKLYDRLLKLSLHEL